MGSENTCWRTVLMDALLLGIVVDGRYRLGAGDEKLAKALTAYYGNVLSTPFSEKKCKELNEKSLSWTANQVHEFLDAGVTKEHFLGLIDFVESCRPAPQLAKIYATSVKEEGPAIVVSGGHQYPVAKMDFGWGCSLFSSYYFPWGGQAGYVVTMPSPVVKGDWVVYMHLLKEHLDHIETCTADFLKPLSSHYLNLN